MVGWLITKKLLSKEADVTSQKYDQAEYCPVIPPQTYCLLTCLFILEGQISLFQWD